MQGRAAIPAPWLEELELNAVIEEIAGDLFVLYDDGDHWQKKYPGY